MSRIYLSPPHMGTLEQEYVREAFDSNWIAPAGPYIDAFEREFAAYVGVKHAAALSSGTAALHLALRILDIQAGDKVFCSDLTFAASANVIRYEHAIPVFIDSEPESWNMSSAALQRALADAEKQGELPKAVIVVNLYGQSANYPEIRKLCDRYGIPIIEDAAESLGATCQGKQTGSFGALGVFSFNGNKIITTSGGGMLVSNNREYIEKARFLATQAKESALHYEHNELGYNYRMSNVLAGIGRGQLQVLDQRIDARRRIFRRYYKALAGYDGIEFMPEAPYGCSTRWLTTLTIDPEVTGVHRTRIIYALEEENIEARPVWKPMHLQPLYHAFDFYPATENGNVSEMLFKQGVCLPSGSSLTPEEQDRVIAILIDTLESTKVMVGPANRSR